MNSTSDPSLMLPGGITRESDKHSTRLKRSGTPPPMPEFKRLAAMSNRNYSIVKVDNPWDFNQDPFHQYLGLTLEHTNTDYARIRLNINDNTPAGIGGSVNGGVLATMIDMAAVPAVFTNIREGSQPAGTADLQITYLRQAHGKWLDAEAQVIKRGRQLCTIHVDIKNDSDVLVATGRVLYALVTQPPSE